MSPAIPTDPLQHILADKIRAAELEEGPEDSLSTLRDDHLTVQKRTQVEPDSLLPKQNIPTVTHNQRVKLDQQIEILYDRVTTELTDNLGDVAFALGKLQQSHDIVLENTPQYEDSLYWVAEVSKMLVVRYNLQRWSYTWGVFVFFMALFWLVLLIIGFFVDVATVTPIGGQRLWYAILAGGLGGGVSILYDLYWHISIKNDFDRQYVIKYLVQPILGMTLGAVMYIFINAGLTAINREMAEFGPDRALAFQILLSFTVGFRNQVIYQQVESVVKQMSGR